MHQTELVMSVLQRRADLMYPKGYILEPESLSHVDDRDDLFAIVGHADDVARCTG